MSDLKTVMADVVTFLDRLERIKAPLLAALMKAHGDLASLTGGSAETVPAPSRRGRPRSNGEAGHATTPPSTDLPSSPPG